jgi:uncharacterized protein YifE (UPF0438 family)
MDFVENEPHRNAISKVFISRSYDRDIKSGDLIIFYRTGEYPAYYHSVVTTLGIAENVIEHIKSEQEFIKLCRKRSVFTDSELSKEWNRYSTLRPFILNFLYVYSFAHRINLAKLIELGVIPSVKDVPRGLSRITEANLRDILRECKVDESIIGD